MSKNDDHNDQPTPRRHPSRREDIVAQMAASAEGVDPFAANIEQLLAEVLDHAIDSFDEARKERFSDDRKESLLNMGQSLASTYAKLVASRDSHLRAARER